MEEPDQASFSDSFNSKITDSGPLAALGLIERVSLRVLIRKVMILSLSPAVSGSSQFLKEFFLKV